MTDAGEPTEAVDGRGRRVAVADLDRPAGAPTGEEFHGLSVLDDSGHPLVPDLAHEYIQREVRDDRTDVELAARFLADEDYALLLTGETGVGKDRLVRGLCARTNRPLVRVNFGSRTPTSSGSTPPPRARSVTGSSGPGRWPRHRTWRWERPRS